MGCSSGSKGSCVSGGPSLWKAQDRPMDYLVFGHEVHIKRVNTRTHARTHAQGEKKIRSSPANSGSKGSCVLEGPFSVAGTRVD